MRQECWFPSQGPSLFWWSLARQRLFLNNFYEFQPCCLCFQLGRWLQRGTQCCWRAELLWDGQWRGLHQECSPFISISYIKYFFKKLDALMEKFASLFDVTYEESNAFLYILLRLEWSLAGKVICCNKELASEELVDSWSFAFLWSFIPFDNFLELFEEVGWFGYLWIIAFGLELWMSRVGEGVGPEWGKLVRRGEIVVLHNESITSSKRTEYPSKWTWMVVLMPYLLMLLILPTFHLC